MQAVCDLAGVQVGWDTGGSPLAIKLCQLQVIIVDIPSSIPRSLQVPLPPPGHHSPPPVHTSRRHPYPRLVSHANYIMDQYVDMYRSRMAGGARAILKRFKALNTHDWRELVRGREGGSHLGG